MIRFFVDVNRRVDRFSIWLVHKVVAKVFSDTKINFCKLCLTEKVLIINALNDSQLLNKKSEFINTYCHQNKLLLKCLKGNNKRHDSMDWKFNVYIILNSYCDIYFLCFLDILIRMYAWWLQQAWCFKLYRKFFLHSLVIKRSTNWALCWNLVTQFIWYILNALLHGRALW